MYYIGFLKRSTNDAVIFRSIKKPKRGDYTYFVKVMGPYSTEREGLMVLRGLKKKYGVRENPVAYCGNPASSERQRRFMCSELGRLRAGKTTQTGMRESQLKDFCTMKVRKKNPGERVRYKVGAYDVDTYREALELAKLLASRTGRIVHVMEKLDSMTPWHSVETVDPTQGITFKNPVKISASQIRRGTIHEREHTTDRRIARQIALDHLREDPKYYTHLAKMEKQYRKNPISAEKAVGITKKLIRAYEAYHKENPGKEYHDRKFLSYIRELEKYAIGSVPYIDTLAKAYEHLESAKES